jgi:hypothetical protein
VRRSGVPRSPGTSLLHMIVESSTRGIALFALVVAILALVVPFIVYIVTRPKLRLSVSNAEVEIVQETGTFTFVEIVAHNDGGRTALIEDWRVARYLGTDRENLWQDITEDVPRTLGVQPHDWTKWRAKLFSPGRVDLHAEEAWSGVDISVTYQPFFFLEPETTSNHNKLGVWKPAEGS